MTWVAPIFIEDDQTTSQITMVNNLRVPIPVDVLLSDLNGNDLARTTVTLETNASLQLKTRDLLNAASHYGPAIGSATLITHRMSTMAAQLSISRRTASGALNDVEEDFAMIMDESQTANFRSVASSIVAAPIVAIRSLSARQRTIRVDCLAEIGRRRSPSISINPSQTLLVQACLEGGPKKVSSLDASFLTGQPHPNNVGIQVSSTAPQKEFAVFGLAAEGQGDDRRIRGMQFTDVNSLRSSTAIYPGFVGESLLLGLRSPRFQMSLANFASSPRQAVILLSGGSDKYSRENAIATVNIPPGGTSLQNIDPEAFSGDVGLDRSLIVQTDGAAGEVITDVELLSSSPDAPIGVPLPWKDSAQVFNGGQHPWRIDGSSSSTLLLFNPDQHQGNSVAVFIYADGHVWNKVFSVPPLATFPLRLNDIVNKQQPDARGRVLPKAATNGIASWFSLVLPKIFGQLVQADLATGIARPFACPQITILCDATLDDLSLQVNQQGTSYGTPITCGSCPGSCGCAAACNVVGGVPDNGGAYFSAWGSANPSIAGLVSSDSASGTYQGNSPGSVQIAAEAFDFNNCSARAFGTLTVKPRLDSISPTKGPVGETTSVTLSGQGFGTSPSVNAGSGITVTINSASDTQIQASFAISSSASGGNRSITVTAAGQTSPAVNFLVQIPTSLSIVAGTDSTTPESSCTYTDVHGNPQTGCGMVRSFMYQVNDQENPPQPIQAALPVWDVITTTTPNNLMITGYVTTCTPANTGPCGVYTSNTGQFEEQSLNVCSSICRSNNVCVAGGPTNATQAIHLGAFVITQNDSYFCDHVTVNGQ